MIPQDRTFYLEMAKLKPKDRRWVMTCFKNYARVWRREQAAMQGSPLKVAY
ncbi:hypothetical protein SAMN05216191_13449 [Paenibacillus jilunlii]|uniref:Uncharacterized protein n=1 Tax=Paenibacillus jilunlii TaxID=682956 RepID=A0A1H0A3N8_9BACL|nr:hypothetical protein SAMN05216191_13449 [Paenibacillus jilunlii]